MAGFNTASGMRSHVTAFIRIEWNDHNKFQYRKRYEVTCDYVMFDTGIDVYQKFQYRKRYEVTCDVGRWQDGSAALRAFQYRKRYEVTCDYKPSAHITEEDRVSIPQAV